MTVETYKLHNGQEFKMDTSSEEFLARLDAAKAAGLRNDDAVYFARQLEYARQQALTVQYSENKFINGGLIPLNRSVPLGAETDSYRIEDRVGQARIGGDQSNDFPIVELTGKEIINKIHTVDVGFSYSIQDMRRDQMVGSFGSQIQRKAAAARRALDETLDTLLSFGDANFGIKGFLTADYIPNNSVSGGTWTTKRSTPNLIIDDVSKALTDMDQLTKGIEMPDTMLVDNVRYNILKNTNVATLSQYEGRTLLNYIETYFNLRVVSVSQIAGKFQGNSNAFVLYRNRNDKIEGIASLIQTSPPKSNVKTTLNYMDARCGGTRVYAPYSVSINYGI